MLEQTFATSPSFGLSPTQPLVEDASSPLKFPFIQKNNDTHYFILNLITRIDDILSKQLSAIINYGRFQRLEALWRSLTTLTQQASQAKNVNIKILPLAKKALARDILYTIDYDQSQLFRKIYGEEFGTPGGKPYGVLLGDYEFSASAPDISLLKAMSQIAAAAFCPFIAGVSPKMFGVNNFTELGWQPDIKKIFSFPEYIRYSQFRRSEDARFIGLCLPKYLVRLPYPRYTTRDMGFNFQASSLRNAYLWSNACFAFGSTLIKAFSDYGWLGNIRGSYDQNTSNGRVKNNVSPYFTTDKTDAARKFTTEIYVSDTQERMLSELGFIPLSQRYGGGDAIFYSNSSPQLATIYKKQSASNNASAATMLQYMFCASRFAHYLKVIGREKIGSFLTPEDCENFLNNWITDYVASNDELALSLRSRYPLQAAKVSVMQKPGKPGSYFCKLYLKPYFQLEQLATDIVLVTEIIAAK